MAKHATLASYAALILDRATSYPCGKHLGDLSESVGLRVALFGSAAAQHAERAGTVVTWRELPGARRLLACQTWAVSRSRSRSLLQPNWKCPVIFMTGHCRYPHLRPLIPRSQGAVDFPDEAISRSVICLCGNRRVATRDRSGAGAAATSDHHSIPLRLLDPRGKREVGACCARLS